MLPRIAAGAGLAPAAAPVLLLALLLTAAPAPAQESSWTLGGSLTQQAYAAAADTGPTADGSYGSTTTLEATLRTRGPVLRAEFSAEAALLTGASAEAFAAAVSALPPDILYAPSDAGVLATAETVLAARVRAAYVKWTAEGFSLTAGRQIVNYGKGIAWSPVDLFTERDFSGLSVARRGSDAVRLTFPLGALSLAEAVAAPASDPSEGTYALRAAGLLFGTLEGSLVGAWDGDSDAWIGGGDLKFDLAWISIHGDAAFAAPSGGGFGDLRAVLGFDTSFGDFVVGAEYYYNGAGTSGDPLFPGAHNAYASLSWSAADYHTLALSALADLEAGLFAATLTWAWDLAQNGVFTTYLRLSNGQAGTESRAGQFGAQLEVKF
jgi:hypothetical protein